MTEPESQETRPDTDLRDHLHQMEAKVRKSRDSRNNHNEQGKRFAEQRNAIQAQYKEHREKLDMSAGNKIDMDGLLFDVDLENIVTEKANLFCYIHNLSDEERQVVLRVHSPDFRPHDLALRYNLEPGEKSWWPDEVVPISSEGDEDIIGRMSGLLRDGTIAWQTLLPERTGEASVSVRLENTNGDLLVGRQINVRVRPEFVNWLRNTSSLTSFLVGGIGLVGSIIFQLMAVLASA